MTNPEPTPYQLMAETAWAMLAEAANDVQHPMRNVSLATVDAAYQPRARMMALRGANRKLTTIWFHSDVDSRKVSELRTHPNVAIVAYDPIVGIQLRMVGKVTLHTDNAIAHDHWEQMTLSLKQCFGRPESGQHLPFADPRLQRIWQHHSSDSTAVDRQRFVVIEVRITCIEWLQIIGSKQWHATLPMVSDMSKMKQHPSRARARGV